MGSVQPEQFSTSCSPWGGGDASAPVGSPCQGCEEAEAAKNRRAAVTSREAQGEGQEQGWMLQGTGKGDVLGLKAEDSSLVIPNKILQPLALTPPRAGLGDSPGLGLVPWNPSNSSCSIPTLQGCKILFD